MFDAETHRECFKLTRTVACHVSTTRCNCLEHFEQSRVRKDSLNLQMEQALSVCLNRYLYRSLSGCQLSLMSLIRARLSGQSKSMTSKSFMEIDSSWIVIAFRFTTDPDKPRREHWLWTKLICLV